MPDTPSNTAAIKQQAPPPPPPKEGVTGLQLGIMVLVLGTSAGLTMYTKKTGSMIQAMNKVTENQLRNRPPKFGPPTKQEWEKLRPRFDKDEFY